MSSEIIVYPFEREDAAHVTAHVYTDGTAIRGNDGFVACSAAASRSRHA